MLRTACLALLVAAGPAISRPALAAEVIGAGSGSTGGTITGGTNETAGSDQTGAANGGETVPSQQGKSGIGTGDNAVLNAPHEAVPGTQPKSQPSNLNGQNPQP